MEEDWAWAADGSLAEVALPDGSVDRFVASDDGTGVRRVRTAPDGAERDVNRLTVRCEGGD